MGKGSSKGHTPREAKDNLKSTQLLSVIDAISEGPVEGPVDGLKSVLLNSTPVLDSEGNTNISGVTVVFRAGEQEQTPPEGFESSGSETVLGTEVKYDTPITHSVSGTAASAGAHTHSMTFVSGGSSGAPGSGSPDYSKYSVNTSSAGAHTHSVSGTAASTGAHAHTVGIGAHTHSVAIGSHGHTITVNAAGNAENTVKNIAFNYIVRLA